MSAPRGVDEVVDYLDERLKLLREGRRVLWGNEAAGEVLTVVRSGLVDWPEWSVVLESNLRAQLAAAVAERDRARLLVRALMRALEACEESMAGPR